MSSKPRATEVDAYVFIKENLKTVGWDTRNPDRYPEGCVWTQNECLGNPEIRRLLGLKRPENIVKVTDKVLWVIEAKRTRGELGDALDDAHGRAAILNKSEKFQVNFITGVAGNSSDGFVVESRYKEPGGFHAITWNGIAVTGFLGPESLRTILRDNRAKIENPKIDERRFLARAKTINEILHFGAVNPHQRANVMSALLLAMVSDTGPNVEERSPTILINDINARVQSVLNSQDKGEFYEHIRIALPSTKDNHVKFRQALVDTLQELAALNIKSAMNSGDDWLGAFYEVFLKYASWAQDLGIVLTPRHLTRWAAEAADIGSADIVYDPTCGTGGFLVAAFDRVKQVANHRQIDNFKQNSLFGIEQDPGVAALAVVNMIFRGDGKNNLREGNCFVWHLDGATNGGSRTATFVRSQPNDPPITKVLMNPPFSLKRGSDKEYRFVNNALAQMEDGGILFTVLPYSAMCKPKGYDRWRKDELLPNHTLLAVVTFPYDVFYPIGVTTVGVFVKKGIPHPRTQKVLWARASTDGFLKVKGTRLPNDKISDDLSKVVPLVRAFLHDSNLPVPSQGQFVKASPIDWDDQSVELVPEVYLDQSKPEPENLFAILEEDLRNLLAYLIKIQKAKLDRSIDSGLVDNLDPVSWEAFPITRIFELQRGHFHSITDLDSGNVPTISRVSTENGLVGFHAPPDGAKIFPAKRITVSSVTGDAFFQPVPFIATDNVVVCTLRRRYSKLKMATLIFIQAMMNHVKWRYSYGRQCYKTKYAKTEIWLPVKASGDLDEEYMVNMVERANHWNVIGKSLEGMDA